MKKVAKIMKDKPNGSICTQTKSIFVVLLSTTMIHSNYMTLIRQNNTFNDVNLLISLNK